MLSIMTNKCTIAAGIKITYLIQFFMDTRKYTHTLNRTSEYAAVVFLCTPIISERPWYSFTTFPEGSITNTPW